MTSSGSSRLWLLVIPLGLALCYSGVFYQTGAQFYEACWQRAHAKDKEASSPEQAARWSTCDQVMEPALFRAGFIYAGAPEYAVTPQLKAIQAACPNRGQIPLATWYLAVDLIQSSSGPTLTDRFLPASSTIVRVVKARWPNCTATAAANGFPRMMVTPQGEWKYETTCLPCKAEEQAMAKHDQEVKEGNSLSEEEIWNGLSEKEKGKKAVEQLMREHPAPQAK